MQECANCGYQNRAGVVFCDNCGASLIGKLPISTKALDTGSEAQAGADGGEIGAVKGNQTQGMATFVLGDSLKLDIEGAVKSVVLQPKTETILGRRDPATGVAPDVDLTPYAGYRMGVSRRHAAIRYGDDNTLNVWDLGSSNGTFLNGQRLNAHRPYRLHDGDELRLGQMIIRLYFKSGRVAPTLEQVSAPAPEQVTTAKPAQGLKTLAGEKPMPQPEPLRAGLTPPPLAMAAAPLKPPGGEQLAAASEAVQPGEPSTDSAPESKAVPEPADAKSAPEAVLPATAEVRPRRTALPRRLRRTRPQRLSPPRILSPSDRLPNRKGHPRLRRRLLPRSRQRPGPTCRLSLPLTLPPMSSPLPGPRVHPPQQRRRMCRRRSRGAKRPIHRRRRLMSPGRARTASSRDRDAPWLDLLPVVVRLVRADDGFSLLAAWVA